MVVQTSNNRPPDARFLRNLESRIVYEASVVSDSQESNLIRNCLESYALTIEVTVGLCLAYIHT